MLPDHAECRRSSCVLSVIAQKRWRTLNGENLDGGFGCFLTTYEYRKDTRIVHHCPLSNTLWYKEPFRPNKASHLLRGLSRLIDKMKDICDVGRESENSSPVSIEVKEFRLFQAHCVSVWGVRGTLHQVLDLGSDMLSYPREWKIWSFPERDSEWRTI